MRKRVRSGDWSALFVELPTALLTWFRGRARRNQRTTTAELRAVLEQLKSRDREGRQ